MLTKRDLLVRSVAFATSAAAAGKSMPARAQGGVSPTEARAIAKEAYIYGFPVVDNYRIQYAYFVDTKNPEYKAPWNHIWNSARLFSPADKAIQTANSDTLYSMVGADLRAEPLVLSVPAMEKDRYFSVQLIDYYTQNFDYIGTRTTGNGGGRSCSPGRAGRVRHQGVSTSYFARRPNWHSPVIAHSSSTPVTSTT